VEIQRVYVTPIVKHISTCGDILLTDGVEFERSKGTLVGKRFHLIGKNIEHFAQTIALIRADRNVTVCINLLAAAIDLLVALSPDSPLVFIYLPASRRVNT